MAPITCEGVTAIDGETRHLKIDLPDKVIYVEMKGHDHGGWALVKKYNKRKGREVWYDTESYFVGREFKYTSETEITGTNIKLKAS